MVSQAAVLAKKEVKDCSMKYFQAERRVYLNSSVVFANSPTLRFANAEKSAGLRQFKHILKEETIRWAWEVVTKVYNLPIDRIYVTYFCGDEKLDLTADDETKDIWLKHLPREKILPFGCNTMVSQAAVLAKKEVKDCSMKYFQAERRVYLNSSVVFANSPTLRFANAEKSAGLRQFKHILKEETIRWAWEVVTKVYNLPIDRIYVTYFCGDEKLDLTADDETKDIWLKHLPREKILPFGCNDNFQRMGDTGACGPCTEIHFDRTGERDAANFVNKDDPALIEIWSALFIQFNREADGSLKPLPGKHVVTRMGFERLTSILQNKWNNYDVDVFLPIFDAIQQATGARTFSGKVGPDDVDEIDMAYRVVADHITILSFAIADGCCPGNDGSEYVLRPILCRAVYYGTEVLKAQQGFFKGLVKVVVDVMGHVFPELKQHEARIRQVIAEEEASFCRPLLHGIEKFKKTAQDVQGKIFSGQTEVITKPAEAATKAVELKGNQHPVEQMQIQPPTQEEPHQVEPQANQLQRPHKKSKNEPTLILRGVKNPKDKLTWRNNGHHRNKSYYKCRKKQDCPGKKQVEKIGDKYDVLHFGVHDCGAQRDALMVDDEEGSGDARRDDEEVIEAANILVDIKNSG